MFLATRQEVGIQEPRRRRSGNGMIRDVGDAGWQRLLANGVPQARETEAGTNGAQWTIQPGAPVAAQPKVACNLGYPAAWQRLLANGVPQAQETGGGTV